MTNIVDLVSFLLLSVYNCGLSMLPEVMLFHYHSASLLYITCGFHGQRILRAGKLTEKVLRLFIATGKDEVISFVEALNIQHVLTPVLPTSELF